MTPHLTEITNHYNGLNLRLENFKIDSESQEYKACRFRLNGFEVISRTAKTTPKKLGQFVTFWKRNEKGATAPFHSKDSFDFFIVFVQLENRRGEFIFPKSVLIEKGLISTNQKVGKRAFRVYPPWATHLNIQATKSQTWQIDYFFEFTKQHHENALKHIFS